MSLSSSSAEKRTPEEWLALLEPDRLILDPDGWRQDDAPAWDEPITAQEFGWRFAMCTIGSKDRA